MKVIPLNDVWITANFKETQLREMKVGQPVTIEVDANGRSYKGKVDSIAGASGARFSSAASRECHRQLRESRAAYSGQDRARSGRKQGSVPAARHVGRSQGLDSAMSAAAATLRMPMPGVRP
jgi:hypothetical protein